MEKILIFESMVFGGEDFDQDLVRYSTYEEAVEGHEKLAYALREWYKLDTEDKQLELKEKSE